MTDKRDDEDPSESGENSSEETDSYRIGYRKPPLESRFKSGQSGNPKGRMKAAEAPPPRKKLLKMALEEGNRLVPIREGEKTTLLPFVQALLRQAGLNAMKGSFANLKQFLELMAAAEKAFPETESEYDLARLTENELLQVRGILQKALRKK